MKKVLLFDIDGTLLDTRELILKCYENTIKVHKLPKKSRKEISKLLGHNRQSAYKILFPETNTEILSETHVGFQEKNLHLVKRFRGVKKTLLALKRRGFKIAAITSRSKRTSKKSLEDNGILIFFDLVISNEDVVNHKPHPESVFKALKKLGFETKDAVMVGDTTIDIQTGKNADIATIGINYGPMGDDVKKAKPDVIISEFSQILKIIDVEK